MSEPTHRVLVGAHLANEAYRSGQRVDWDPVNLERVSRRGTKS